MSAADWIKARAASVLGIMLGAALLVVAIQSFALDRRADKIVGLEASLKKARQDYAELQSAVAGQTEAARKSDEANTARAVAQQKDITEDRLNAYRNRISALAARVAGLRKQAAAAPRGRQQAAPVPAACRTASGPDGTAGTDGFSLELRADATRIAIRLDELQKWVKSQSEVDNSGAVSAAAESALQVP